MSFACRLFLEQLFREPVANALEHLPFAALDWLARKSGENYFPSG